MRTYKGSASPRRRHSRDTMVSSSCRPRFNKHPLVRAVQGALTGWALASTGLLAPPVQAQAPAGPESVKKRFDIPPSQLDYALSLLKTQSGVLLSVDPRLTHGKTTAGLRGDHTVAEAFAAVLADSGLELAAVSDAVYVLRERQAPAALVRVADAEPEPAKPPEEPVQDAPVQGKPVQLEPMVVTGQPLDQDQGFKANYQTTATKTPLSIRETPQSVSVITQDQLKARQVIDIGQALQTVAGVNQITGVGPFAGRSSFNFGQAQIRGINGGLFTDRDEEFLSPIALVRPDVAAYERLEVIKGPSSVLYGRGSAGGFVNRVRKKPLPEFHAELTPSIGSFDFYRIDGDITGPLFDSDAARGRLVLAYEDSGAFVDGVDSERVVAAPSLEFDLTDSTRLLLLGTFQYDDYLPNTGIPLVRDGDTVRAPDVRRSLYLGTPNEDEESGEILSGIAVLEQQIGDHWLATLRLNRSASRFRGGSENYAYAYPALDAGFGGNVPLYASVINGDEDVWAGDVRLNGDFEAFGRPTRLTLGVDHTRFERDIDFRAVSLGTTNIYEENFGDFPTREPTPILDELGIQKGTGVYVQTHIRPWERLGVLLGGRYDWADTSREERLVGSKVEGDDQDFTGRAGLTFDVLDNVTVYGLYAQSFDPVLDAGADGQPLDPETGETYELGVKSEWLDGRLGITAAAFRIDRDNVAIPAPTPPGVPGFSISSGLQRSDGFELEINGEPLPGWNLSFGGSLLDSEFKERNDPFFGSKPAGTADWQLGLFSGYELQTGVLEGLGFGVGLFAIDDRGASPFVPDATLEGYERVDLHAFYNGFKPLKIQLQVRNVFDERYVESVGAGFLNYAQFGSPTAVLLTVRFDLDGLLDGLGN